MHVPIWIMFMVVFLCGWFIGVMGTYRDMQKNPKRFYEKYIKFMVAEQEHNENEKDI